MCCTWLCRQSAPHGQGAQIQPPAMCALHQVLCNWIVHCESSCTFQSIPLQGTDLLHDLLCLQQMWAAQLIRGQMECGTSLHHVKNMSQLSRGACFYGVESSLQSSLCRVWAHFAGFWISLSLMQQSRQWSPTCRLPGTISQGSMTPFRSEAMPFGLRGSSELHLADFR